MAQKTVYERSADLNRAEADGTGAGWNIGVNGSGKLGWFVLRKTPNGNEYLLNKKGAMRRFGFEGAVSAAEKANAEDAQITAEALRRRRNHLGRSFEQAEIEDEILIGELGCSVKFWSDNGINETKRLHFYTTEQTYAIGNAAIVISDTQAFESYREHLNAELEEVRQINMNRLGTAGEALLAALENALALLGTDIEKGMK